MNINRRDLFKLGASALIAAVFNPVSFAQTQSSSAVSSPGSAKASIDGMISYNAGWVVPLEDKNQLLELEAKKTKEKEELAKQKSSPADASAAAQEKPKSFSDKFQNALTKLKNFF